MSHPRDNKLDLAVPSGEPAVQKPAPAKAGGEAQTLPAGGEAHGAEGLEPAPAKAGVSGFAETTGFVVSTISLTRISPIPKQIT